MHLFRSSEVVKPVCSFTAVAYGPAPFQSHQVSPASKPKQHARTSAAQRIKQNLTPILHNRSLKCSTSSSLWGVGTRFLKVVKMVKEAKQ